MTIHDPTRVASSAFDRIADRIRERQASKADVDRVKSREHCEEAPTIVPEVKKDEIEDNLRVRVKVASVGEIPKDFRHLGSGLYKNAHALWELRTAEDDQGGYVLVRKFEERAVDLRDGSPRDTALSLASPKSTSLASRKAAQQASKSEKGAAPSTQFETGDRVQFPWKGKIAQAVVIMMMPEGNSAMVDRGDGMPEELATSEMSKVDGEDEETQVEYMDPGHPELAHLGPMSGTPNPDAPMVDHEGSSGERGERENMGNSTDRDKLGESEKEGSTDRPFERGQPSSDITELRGESRGWHPEISEESKHAPINASREGFVVLAVDRDDMSYEERYGYPEPDPRESPLSYADEAGYESLPGGMGVTVSEEMDPRAMTPSTHRPPIVRSPSGDPGAPIHSSEWGDRVPMGELIPDEELQRIYKNMPEVLRGVTNLPKEHEQVNRPPNARPMPQQTVMQRNPSMSQSTVVGRPPSGRTQVPGSEDPTLISPTTMAPVKK